MLARLKWDNLHGLKLCKNFVIKENNQIDSLGRSNLAQSAWPKLRKLLLGKKIMR